MSWAVGLCGLNYWLGLLYLISSHVGTHGVTMKPVPALGPIHVPEPETRAGKNRPAPALSDLKPVGFGSKPNPL